MSLRSCIAAFVLACATVPALAQAPRWPDALGGRLQAIKASGTVRLGFREHAIPFSYLGPDGRPVGYSIDLCEAVVATLAADLGRTALRVEHVRVTPDDRVDKVASGAVDLECGATTNTAERRQRVAFSPVIFVTGTRLAVRRGSAIRDVAGLKGRSVAVVRGTTAEATLREVERLWSLGASVVATTGYPEALDLVVAGRADALAADDILLRGLLAETRRTGEVTLVGDLLSFEAYGIMIPRDDAALADAVDRTLRQLAASREIVWIHDRWFVRPLPSGVRLGLPLSAQLRRSFELLGLPPD